MRVGILGGTGKEGRGLALRWAMAGHEVIIGSRQAERAQERAEKLTAKTGHAVSGAHNQQVAGEAEVLVLSVPYSAHRKTLLELQPVLLGQTLIDITVPLVPPAVREVHLPEGQSAAMEAQALLGSEVRVVAALHHLSSVHLADPEHVIDSDVLVCGDDAAARDLAITLISDLGVRALDAGALCNAIALESLTPVLLHLNRRYQSKGCGLRITGLPDPS